MHLVRTNAIPRRLFPAPRRQRTQGRMETDAFREQAQSVPKTPVRWGPRRIVPRRLRGKGLRNEAAGG